MLPPSRSSSSAQSANMDDTLHVQPSVWWLEETFIRIQRLINEEATMYPPTRRCGRSDEAPGGDMAGTDAFTSPPAVPSGTQSTGGDNPRARILQSEGSPSRTTK